MGRSYYEARQVPVCESLVLALLQFPRFIIPRSPATVSASKITRRFARVSFLRLLSGVLSLRVQWGISSLKLQFPLI